MQKQEVFENSMKQTITLLKSFDVFLKRNNKLIRNLDHFSRVNFGVGQLVNIGLKILRGNGMISPSNTPFKLAIVLHY